MAVVAGLVTSIERGVWRVQWSNLANGDTGSLEGMTRHQDKSIQVEGTYGAAGSVSIEGSNDGSNFHTLVDPQGNALTFTVSDRIEAVLENPRHIRPNVTAGDGTTDLTVTMIVKG